jgi:phosphatidylinositol-3-phosphatase
MFRHLAIAVAALIFATLAATAAPIYPIAIHHVFVIVLENEDYATIFGPGTPSPYLGHDLPAQGALFTNYYATGHASLGNYIAMVSAQPEAPMLQADCDTYQDFTPGTLDAHGVATGNGCVFPASVKTVADQLEAKGFTWHGYMEDMGNDPDREARSCAHPALPGGNGVLKATPTDSYAYRHNPFIYFHSIIDRQAACDANDVRLDTLPDDLAVASRTPNLAFIVPSVCNDGHDIPKCADGSPGGLPKADAWLKVWVPRIVASPAFQKDGLLIVTFDEAARDATACCSEPSGPNVKQQGFYGPGGGRIGAVVLSPFVTPGAQLADPVNHYGLTKSIEEIFGLPHLALANDPQLGTLKPAYLRAFKSGRNAASKPISGRNAHRR